MTAKLSSLVTLRNHMVCSGCSEYRYIPDQDLMLKRINDEASTVHEQLVIDRENRAYRTLRSATHDIMRSSDFGHISSSHLEASFRSDGRVFIFDHVDGSPQSREVDLQRVRERSKGEVLDFAISIAGSVSGMSFGKYARFPEWSESEAWQREYIKAAKIWEAMWDDGSSPEKICDSVAKSICVHWQDIDDVKVRLFQVLYADLAFQQGKSAHPFSQRLSDENAAFLDRYNGSAEFSVKLSEGEILKIISHLAKDGAELNRDLIEKLNNSMNEEIEEDSFGM